MGKLKNFIDKSLEFLLVGMVVYGVDFAGGSINLFRNRNIYFNQPFYNSKEEIERDLKIEKRKLGLEKIPIRLGFDREVDIALVNFKEKGDYNVFINLNYISKAAMKHELCHIKSVESGSLYSSFYEYRVPILRRIEEWNATSCSLDE